MLGFERWQSINEGLPLINAQDYSVLWGATTDTLSVAPSTSHSKSALSIPLYHPSIVLLDFLVTFSSLHFPMHDCVCQGPCALDRRSCALAKYPNRPTFLFWTIFSNESYFQKSLFSLVASSCVLLQSPYTGDKY